MYDLIISGYDGSNDLRMFIKEAYRRCTGAIKGEPVDFYEFYDNLTDIVIDSGITFFTFDGITVNRYQLEELLLEDVLFLELKIEYINSFGKHVNDSQIIMFEEMIT